MKWMIYQPDIVELLTNRIVELIPQHPDILEMDDVWSLFTKTGFRCNDLGPSLAQAQAALNAAKRKYRAAQNHNATAEIQPSKPTQGSR